MTLLIKYYFKNLAGFILILALLNLLTSCGKGAKTNQKKPSINKSTSDTKLREELNDSPYLDNAPNLNNCESFELTHNEFKQAFLCDKNQIFLITHTNEIKRDDEFDIQNNLYKCGQENLVQNGSFESHDKIKKNNKKSFSNIPFWTNFDEELGETPQTVPSFELFYGDRVGGIKASHGLTKLQLDGKKEKKHKYSDAKIIQKLNLTPNKAYLLKFKYAAQKRWSSKSNRINVSFNNKVIAQLNSNKRKWQEYSIIVYSTQFISKLEFSAINDRDHKGGFIDEVSLTEVCSVNY